MRSSFKLDNVNDINATLSITLSLREWKQMRAQLGDAWPSWHLGRHISDLIAAAEKHFSLYDAEKLAVATGTSDADTVGV